jgi:tryptophan 2,3-dioxygenase
LSHQLDVLETMTPLEFLEFRDLLFPASGFRSVQFRLIEVRLGMRGGQRLHVDERPYAARMSKAELARALV